MASKEQRSPGRGISGRSSIPSPEGENGKQIGWKAAVALEQPSWTNAKNGVDVGHFKAEVLRQHGSARNQSSAKAGGTLDPADFPLQVSLNTWFGDLVGTEGQKSSAVS